MERLKPSNYEEIDTNLEDADWPLIYHLWRVGIENNGVYRLLRLRNRIRKKNTDPAFDGFENNNRAQFARWLVKKGMLNEG